MYGNDCRQQYLSGLRFPSEVKRSFSTTFCFSIFLLDKRLVQRKTGWTALCKLQHHHLCCALPFAIWFARECPRATFPHLRSRENAQLLVGKSRAYADTRDEFGRQVSLVVLLRPIDVVVHRHGNDAILEIFFF